MTRTQLARAAQIDLTEVKRVLGFLLLSEVIEVGNKGVRVIDWKRLCRLSDYDPSWGSTSGDEDEDLAPDPVRQAEPRDLTAAGDPASFA